MSRYSLIQRKHKEKTYSLHRLVQDDALRSNLDDGEHKAGVAQAHKAMARIFPFAEQATWSTCARLLVHALYVAELEGDAPSGELGSLAFNLGAYLDHIAQYKRALEFYERSLEIRRAALGDEHPSVAQSLNDMAVVYQSQGANEKALELYERFLGKKRSDLSDEQLSVATGGHIYIVYEDEGRVSRLLSWPMERLLKVFKR